MTDRTNEQWLADLQTDGQVQADALEELHNRVQRSIYFYLSRERSDLRNYSDKDLVNLSNDLAQDTVLRVLDNIQHFRGESKFTTWVNKIAIRLTISELRRTRYKNFSLDELTADGEFLPQSATLSGLNNRPPNPENVAEQEDVTERIYEALQSALTERQYKALIAVALQGIPMDVVAEQLGTNRNALYKLIHDARRKLRRHLEAEGLPVDYMMGLFEK